MKMKKAFLIILFLIFVIGFTWSDPIIFTKTFGGEGSDIGYCIEKTQDGSNIIVGYTQSEGNGSADIYIIKTDSNGNIQ